MWNLEEDKRIKPTHPSDNFQIGGPHLFAPIIIPSPICVFKWGYSI
jgi:hypothetical protein